MSVAFRRESDEEHKEPRFELPLPPGPNLVTPAGLAMLETRVAELEAALAAAPEAEREGVLRDLRYFRTRASTAEVTLPITGEVSFGSRVSFALNGEQRTIDLVGSDEADPAASRIAFTAPLAQAMMGLARGDFANFQGKEDAIELLVVEPIPE